MEVKIEINKNWSKDIEGGIEKGQLEMVTDVHKRAGIIAPKDTRALLNSGVIERVRKFHYVVRFGNARVPYARKRHYENKKNPQTLRYLEKAGEAVVRGGHGKYYRNKIK